MGVLSVEAAGAEEPIVVRTEGYGLTSAGGGLTLGFGRQELVMVSGASTCQVVVADLPEDEVLRSRLEDLVEDYKNICLAGRE